MPQKSRFTTEDKVIIVESYLHGETRKNAIILFSPYFPNNFFITPKNRYRNTTICSRVQAPLYGILPDPSPASVFCCRMNNIGY